MWGGGEISAFLWFGLVAELRGCVAPVRPRGAVPQRGGGLGAAHGAAVGRLPLAPSRELKGWRCSVTGPALAGAAAEAMQCPPRGSSGLRLPRRRHGVEAGPAARHHGVGTGLMWAHVPRGCPVGGDQRSFGPVSGVQSTGIGERNKGNSFRNAVRARILCQTCSFLLASR